MFGRFRQIKLAIGAIKRNVKQLKIFLAQEKNIINELRLMNLINCKCRRIKSLEKLSLFFLVDQTLKFF